MDLNAAQISRSVGSKFADLSSSGCSPNCLQYSAIALQMRLQRRSESAEWSSILMEILVEDVWKLNVLVKIIVEESIYY